jgi:hypothetical protein
MPLVVASIVAQNRGKLVMDGKIPYFLLHGNNWIKPCIHYSMVKGFTEIVIH